MASPTSRFATSKARLHHLISTRVHGTLRCICHDELLVYLIKQRQSFISKTLLILLVVEPDRRLMIVGYAANCTFARKNIHHLMLLLCTESKFFWPISTGLEMTPHPATFLTNMRWKSSSTSGLGVSPRITLILPYFVFSHQNANR
jgi:hypothetical protein